MCECLHFYLEQWTEVVWETRRRSDDSERYSCGLAGLAGQAGLAAWRVRRGGLPALPLADPWRALHSAAQYYVARRSGSSGPAQQRGQALAALAALAASGRGLWPCGLAGGPLLFSLAVNPAALALRTGNGRYRSPPRADADDAALHSQVTEKMVFLTESGLALTARAKVPPGYFDGTESVRPIDQPPAAGPRGAGRGDLGLRALRPRSAAPRRPRAVKYGLQQSK